MEHGEFPQGVLARLNRIRTVSVALDADERVVRAAWRQGITTPDDRRELFWILGSAAWPQDWEHELREVATFA
jgi:hypothetical protein